MPILIQSMCQMEDGTWEKWYDEPYEHDDSDSIDRLAPNEDRVEMARQALEDGDVEGYPADYKKIEAEIDWKGIGLEHEPDAWDEHWMTLGNIRGGCRVVLREARITELSIIG